jgi:hypothetical protein
MRKEKHALLDGTAAAHKPEGRSGVCKREGERLPFEAHPSTLIRPTDREAVYVGRRHDGSAF